MAHFDVFNGDADGLCALHQLRLVMPREAILVTGVKRDIGLLARVTAAPGDSVTVLDVSIDFNRYALMGLLERGVSVEYFDHHAAGEVPRHALLHAVIDTAPDVCTGLLVDRHLHGRQRIWALVAAYGDNLAEQANALAQTMALSRRQRDALQSLGECLNYNGYGDDEADLVIGPAALYALLRRYADPFEFIRAEAVYEQIRLARERDLGYARRIQARHELPEGSIFILPDAAWSRRVRGEYANHLANMAPHRAHAVLTPDASGAYMASVRAPLASPHGADRLCRLFHSGGGRAGAAGINHLAPDQLALFVRSFAEVFHGGAVQFMRSNLRRVAPAHAHRRAGGLMEAHMSVGDICNRNVIIASPHLGVSEAARLMYEQHVGSLVVVDETDAGRVIVGMLTDRDIVVAVVARDVDPQTLRVADVMSGAPVMVRPEVVVHDVLALMRRHGVRRIPVTTAQGVLIGIVTLDDLLEVVAGELSGVVHVIQNERMREERMRG